jgi:hypothetical protein
LEFDQALVAKIIHIWIVLVKQNTDGKKQHFSEEMAPNVDSLIVNLEKAPGDVPFALVVYAVARLNILVVLVPDRDIRDTPLTARATVDFFPLQSFRVY